MRTERGRKLAGALSALCCILALAIAWVPTAPVTSRDVARLPMQDKPELEELDSFEGNSSPNAYDRAVIGSAPVMAASDAQLFSAEGAAPAVAPEREWTVMMYIVGSNLESQFGAATDDFREIDAAGIDFSRANVIAYTGGSKRWNVDIPNDRNCVLDFSRPEGERIVSQTASSADMGAPATLTSFVNWTRERYPAKHYALILWDHGGGPLWGYGVDELNGGDTLLLPELRSALQETPFGTERKLDLIGFDACLMGSVENALMCADFADYLVASEEVEAGGGWDYTFLAQLGLTSDACEVAKQIVDSYGQYYAQHATPLSKPDATLAACDLSRIGEVETALDELGDAMAREIESGRYAQLNRTRAHAKAFGLVAAPTRAEAYDLVDLGDLAEGLAESCPDQSSRMLEALQGAIVASTSNVEGTHGLSVYFPGENRDLYQAVGEDMQANVGDAFASFKRTYAKSWLTASDVDWKLAAPTLSADKREYLIKLTKEQVENLSDARFTVLASGFEGSGYRKVAVDLAAEVDEDGVVHVPVDPQVVAGASREIGSSSETSVPWCVSQVEGSTSGRMRFKAENTRLSPMWDAYDPFGMTDNLNVSLDVDAKDRSVTIGSFTPASGVGELAGRSTIDAEAYVSIMNSFGSELSLTRGADGSILPCSQWEKTSSTSWNKLALDDFHFKLCKISECCDVDSFSQVCVTDVNGEVHASELVELGARERDYRDVKLKTDAGSITVRVSGNQAAVIEYRGKDEALSIPAEVESVPVTEIAGLWPSTSGRKNTTVKSVTIPSSVKSLGTRAFENFMSLEQVSLPEGLERIGREAFSGCDGLKQLDIPEGVKFIGAGAFANSGIERLRLPKSLEQVSTGAFSYLSNLASFEQAAPGKATEVRDGVLFSADGKTLISCPAMRTGAYEVPAGVETLGYGAFASSALSSITLPDGLLRIEPYALEIDGDRESIALPESVEHIATRAFGSSFLREFGEGAIDLRIGASATFIGDEAFVGLNVASFSVDEANPQYASRGGFLTNKTGDTILEAPSALGDVVVVPEGITTIPSGVLGKSESNAPARGYVLPNSAFRISARAFPYTIENASNYVEGEQEGDVKAVYKAVFHCEEGSAAEAFAQKHDIEYDNEMDPEALRSETKTIEDGGVVYELRVCRDHATVVDISDAGGAHPERASIPAEVDGVAVTGVATGPNGSATVAKAIVIPASVESVTGGSFRSAVSVERFEVEQGSEHFMAQDGVLFNADGSELVAFPRDRAVEKYSIPDSVESIGDYAFSATCVERVIAPESVERIGDHAFESSNAQSVELAEGLEEIGDYAFAMSYAKGLSLPPTVERIGDYAFSNVDDYSKLDLPRDLEYLGAYAFGYTSEPQNAGGDKLRVGEGLVHIGHGALMGLDVKSYEVDAANPQYEAAGPLLIDKQAKAVVMCAPRAEGVVRIPDGILEIDYGAFGSASAVTDIYVPDSVQRMGGAFESSEYGEKISAVIHCSAGSAAARYAQAQGVSWVEDN